MNLNVIYHLLKFWFTYKYEGLIKDMNSSVKNMTRKPRWLKIGVFSSFFNEMELQERVGSVRGLHSLQSFSAVLFGHFLSHNSASLRRYMIILEALHTTFGLWFPCCEIRGCVRSWLTPVEWTWILTLSLGKRWTLGMTFTLSLFSLFFRRMSIMVMLPYFYS